MAAALTTPAECVASDISTVDPAWAASYVTSENEDCPQGNGVIVLHLQAGAWRNAFEGAADEGPCPLDPAVPDSVARDLGLCFKPSSKVYLSYWDGHLKYKPKTLVQGAHGLIKKLTWKQWGKPVASGMGTFDYADAYTAFDAPVKVRLSQRGFCGHKRAYLRIGISAARASDRSRLRFMTGTTSLDCPDS